MGATICYCRVSTEKQNLERQLQATADYCRRRDIDSWDTLTDKSTGTDVDRSGYREMMSRVRAGEIETVVAHEVSRIARSISDLQKTADELRENSTELHIISSGLVLGGDETDPYQKALFQMLGVFAELEADIKRENIREGIAARKAGEDYRHGPAPLGFEKDSGELVRGPRYHEVVEILERVARGDLSQRKGARELGCGRKTIRTAIRERPELYGL